MCAYIYIVMILDIYIYGLAYVDILNAKIFVFYSQSHTDSEIPLAATQNMYQWNMQVSFFNNIKRYITPNYRSFK